MDIGKAFTFVNEDERWITKIGIGVLVMLATMFILFPFVFLVGYQLAIMRNVMEGRERPLPEWDNLGKLFIDGLSVTVALIVYTLPFWLLLCIGLGVSFLPALGGGNESMTGILGGVAALTWVVLACLIILLAIGLFLAAPAVYIQYVRNDNIGACFRVGEVVAILRAHIGDILVAAVVGIVANFALGLVVNLLSATLCLIIVAIPLGWVGSVWIMAALGHLYGQIAAKFKAGKIQHSF